MLRLLGWNMQSRWPCSLSHVWHCWQTVVGWRRSRLHFLIPVWCC